MIFRTLRWRMVAAFAVVILITLLLSGGLSLWATSNRFAILVTDEGRTRAEEIAPLLEVNYALQESWAGLEALLDRSGEPAASFVGTEWVSDIDWFIVVADTLGLDEEDLWDQWDRLGRLTAVAQANGQRGEQLIEAIMEEEEDALDTAVDTGLLSAAEAEASLEWLDTAVAEFINDGDSIEIAYGEGIDWDLVAAQELGWSLGKFYAQWERDTIADFSDAAGVPPEQIIAAIMQAEQDYIETAVPISDVETSFYLADTLTLARDYVYESGTFNDYFLSEEPDVYGLLTDSLFGDQRVIIADNDALVVYDSSDELMAEVLSTNDLQQGVTLWNLSQTEPIGTLIIATGDGVYNAQQTAFLQGVAWSMLISGLLAGLVALLAGVLAARGITKPVTAVTEAANHLADGAWQERLPVTSADELGQMSAAFNKMATALQTQHTLRKRLVDDIAHELHTPLSVIQLELEAMRDGLQSPQQATTQTLQEIALLRNLVDDLSLLTEMDEDSLQLNLQPVDLLTLTQQAVQRWQPQAKATGISLTMEASAPLPTIQADALRLTQVLGNLLANAIEHTGENGRITVTCTQVEAEGRVGIETAVADTGRGIPAEDLPHIFDRFYQVEQGRNRSGRGLGLSITQQIIAQHGGEIEVKSTLGKGTAFRYRLLVG